MAVKLAFNEFPQFIDGDGVPITGAQLFTYIAGSSTKATTYQDDAGSTPNSNPIVCDSAGRVPYPVWLTTGVSYKFVLAPADDTDPPTSPIWTLDDVTGINDASISADQWVAGPTPTYISATSFSLVGDQTSVFTVGRRVKTTNSGGTVYGTIASSAYTSLTTITVVNDSGELDAGLSAVSYGVISSVDSSLPMIAGETSDFTYANGRLTLSTGVPVTTSDVTNATTVYFTPYKGNLISLYDGYQWTTHVFTELSQATTDDTKSPAAAANNSNYDVFVWDDAGTLRATRGPLWSSATARGTGAGTTQLELFEGRYVNAVDITNGPAARRGLYVGSFRSNGTAKVDDVLTWRGVWNNYNRVPRPMNAGLSTNRATTNDFPGEVNAETRLTHLVGLVEDAIEFSANVVARNSGIGNTITYSIGIDGTTAEDCTQSATQYVADYLIASAMTLKRFPSLGLHYATFLGGDNGGTTTWIGAGSGAVRCSLKGVMLG